jgi:hypothetical protein
MRSNYNKAGLFIAEASPGKLCILNLGASDTSVTPKISVDLHTNRTTYSSTATSLNHWAEAPIWLRIIVTSSSNVEYQYSTNGLVYRSLLSGHNPAFTVGAVGLMVGSENATYPGRAAFDWIRFT